MAALRPAAFLAALAVAVTACEGDDEAPDETGRPTPPLDEQPFELASSGRLLLPEDGHGIDDEGNPVFWTGYCAADAVALLDGDSIAEVLHHGDVPDVVPGEQVARTTNEHAYRPVYRSDDGSLREGCAPESSEYQEIETPGE